MQSSHSPLQDLDIPMLELAASYHLRSRREELKMSQRELARQLAAYDIPSSRSLINKYEIGPGKGGSKMTLAAARAFGIILFGRETGLLDSLDSVEFDAPEQIVNPDVAG